MSETIRVERREGYRVIAINRAERMNALDRDSVVALTGRAGAGGGGRKRAAP